jgi:hypothetical protein
MRHLLPAQRSSRVSMAVVVRRNSASSTSICLRPAAVNRYSRTRLLVSEVVHAAFTQPLSKSFCSADARSIDSVLSGRHGAERGFSPA